MRVNPRVLLKLIVTVLQRKFDGKYTDKQLDALVDKGYDYMMNEIMPLAKKCFDKVT